MIFTSDGKKKPTTRFRIADLDDLPAGDKTCSHRIVDSSAVWTTFQFEAPSYGTDGAPLPNLTWVSHTSSCNPTDDGCEIAGEARSDHGSRVETVSPIATLYDPSGFALGCEFTYISSTHLDPGGSSSFKHLIGENAQLIHSYRLQIDGAPE